MDLMKTPYEKLNEYLEINPELGEVERDMIAQTYYRVEDRMEADDAETAIKDTVADLMHIAHALGLSWPEIAERADLMFTSECWEKDGE